MKRIFIFLLISTIFSCQPSQQEKNNSNPTTKNRTELILPDFVQNYLANGLRGWKLASKESWDDTTFKKYQTDSSQINYILADFNCDNKPDFAAILKDSTGNFAAFKISSVEQYYLHGELESYGKQEKLYFGIRFLYPGSTFQRYDGSFQVFDCGAIEKFFTKSGSKKIFFIDKKGISSVIEKGE